MKYVIAPIYYLDISNIFVSVNVIHLLVTTFFFVSFLLFLFTCRVKPTNATDVLNKLTFSTSVAFEVPSFLVVTVRAQLSETMIILQKASVSAVSKQHYTLMRYPEKTDFVIP